MPRLYDISQELSAATPVWPGDHPVRVEWRWTIGAGSPVNVATLHLTAHAGSHADAARHFEPDGATVGSLSLEPFLGPARLVEVLDRPSIGPDEVRLALAAPGATPSRVLFKTRRHAGEGFDPNFAWLEPGAAEVLAAAGVRLVGLDSPSVDPADSKALPAHKILGRGGVAILENLALAEVPPGEYELIALPLRLKDADASPVRAVLRPLA